MTGRPDMYANFPNPPNSSKLSLNGIGETQERGHVPSSCFSSFVQHRLQFPALLQPHSCTFISFFTFIYLFSNSRIDEKQGCTFTERGPVCYGGTCLDSCSWLKEPLWMTGHCLMSSVPLYCTSCLKKIYLFSSNMHMLWNSPIAVPFSLSAELLSLPLWCSLAQEQLMLTSRGSFQDSWIED